MAAPKVDAVAYPIMQFDNVRILQDDPHSEAFLIQKENGLIVKVDFCPDFKPPLYAGMQLDFLHVEDHGTCWSVLNVHPAYRIRRHAEPPWEPIWADEIVQAKGEDNARR